MGAGETLREVAARLRMEAGVPFIGDFTFTTLLNAALTDGQPMPTNNADLMLCLADLIDPTCHDAEHGETNGFTCSECGEWTPLDEPSFCPSCGARVVTGDD